MSVHRARISRAIVYLSVLMVAVLFQTASTAQDKDQINREELIFVVEDISATFEYYKEVADLDSALYRAESWLADSTDQNLNVGESVMNARAIVGKVESRLPELRKRLAEFPLNGPSFPPVFYWDTDWAKVQSAWLDQHVLQIGYLNEESAAIDAGDWAKIQQIRLQRVEDKTAFSAYYRSSGQKFLSRLPEDHPERLLGGLFDSDHDVYRLHADRVRSTSEDEIYELTLQIIEAMKGAEGAKTEIVEKVEAALPGHHADLLPFAEVLTLDPATAEKLTDEVIESYRASLVLVRQMMRIDREITKLEAKYWKEGWSPDLAESYSALSIQGEDYRDEYIDTARLRAALMVKAIAR